MKLLNIGCGSTYHPAWVNIDVEPVSRDVMRHDAGRPLPFEDGSFDACYCSHLLEHLSPAEACLLVTEMRRVLKSGGVIRVVVPDLEGVVRAYLGALEHALSATKGTGPCYDWIILELLDQMVRSRSGGQMGEFLRKCPPDLRGMVASRIGSEVELFWANEGKRGRGVSRFSGKSPAWFGDQVRFLLVCLCARLLGGKRGLLAVKEGWFRTSGEAHRWMYDRFSLGRLLEEAMFDDVVVCASDVSRIPGFSGYGLDAVDGAVRKPDSLFMEGVSP